MRGCGVGDASAYDLLHDGGFATTGTQHDGPGFVCRVGSGAFHGGTPYPTPAQDPCVNTPPASAYWTFWIAEPGQSGWSYGRVGAVTYQPNAGEVEVWRFGATPTDGSSGAPPYSPATLRAAPVASPRPRPPPPTPAPRPPQPPQPGQRRPRPTPAPERFPCVRIDADRESSHSSVLPTQARGTASGSAPVVVAASSAAAHPAAGSAVPALLGAAAVAVLAAGAGALAWRRRSQQR